ncbi:MAG: hypothetical protein ACEY3K_03415, partial [Wolbachia sp.]
LEQAEFSINNNLLPLFATYLPFAFHSEVNFMLLNALLIVKNFTICIIRLTFSVLRNKLA